MNFPTAWHHAKQDGAPIARASWSSSEGVPTQWVTFEGGAAYLYTATTRTIIVADDLLEGDFRASDWNFPEGCSIVVEEKADIGGESQAGVPTFDVTAPPCVVS